MALFSQRKGIRPLQKAIQREAIDDELRNRLWSALKLIVWDHFTPRDALGYMSDDSRRVLQLVEAIWLHHFKAPVDTIPDFASGYPKSAYQVLREYFFDGQWWQVYDFIEFVIKASDQPWGEQLAETANTFLEAENAAYRVVDTEIIEITDEQEIAAIESAIDKSTKAAGQHISRAVALLSDRRHPDYRNSIKESISAVEAVCQALSGNSKGTLADCLKALKAKGAMHPALESAFLKLYGYTSDSGGIRHALTEDTQSPTFADAKFMLVACSGFVGFLWTKAAENGVRVTGG